MRQTVRRVESLVLLSLFLVISCGSGQEVNAPGPVPLPQGAAGNYAAQGSVTATIGSSEVKAGQTIDATLANGLAETIYTADMKSGCTIAILERQRGEEWEPLMGCGMERLPIVISIEPGGSEDASIDTASIHFASPSGTGESAIVPGIYRVRFAYRMLPGREGIEDQSAISETFTIQP